MVFGVVALTMGGFAAVFPGITLLGLIGGIATFGIFGGIALLIGAGKMQFFEREVLSQHAGAPVMRR